jgi:hypothetical protein
LASSNIVFEAFLLSLDGEADVFVEVNVAASSDVDMEALLFVRVSFHFLMVVECLTLQSIGLWSRRFNAEAFQKVFDEFEESVISGGHVSRARLAACLATTPVLCAYMSNVLGRHVALRKVDL